MAKTLELHKTLIDPTRQNALMRKQFLPLVLFSRVLFRHGMDSIYDAEYAR